MSRIGIDVVSDVVCPWCFIGKRHLDQALAQWRAEHPDSEVAVTWHPFFLNPDTPEAGEPYRPFLEKKFGGPRQVEELWQRVSAAGLQAGIAFAFEKITLRANTLNAHRLIHHAQTVAAGGTAIDNLVEALFAAQFLDGRHVGDRAVLADLASASGMEREATLRYLESTEDAYAVRRGADEARSRGINGVPFFIFNHRLAASGAQPPDILLRAMRQATEAA